MTTRLNEPNTSDVLYVTNYDFHYYILNNKLELVSFQTGAFLVHVKARLVSPPEAGRTGYRTSPCFTVANATNVGAATHTHVFVKLLSEHSYRKK